MDAKGFFFAQHRNLHGLESGAAPSYVDRVFGGLSDGQMRARPGRGLNSLIWLLWHMARTEDAAVNLVVADGQQVLNDEWRRRMNIPSGVIGTGMTEDEVGELTKVADVDGVRAYRAAVGRRTRDVVGTLAPAAWDEIIGIADTARASAAGAFAPRAAWVEGVGYKAWQGHSRAAQLASSASAHNVLHLVG